MLALTAIQTQILILWLPLMPFRCQSCPFSVTLSRAGQSPPDSWNKLAVYSEWSRHSLTKEPDFVLYRKNWWKKPKKSWSAWGWLLNQTLHKIQMLRLKRIRKPAIKNTKTKKTHTKSPQPTFYNFAPYVLMVLLGERFVWNLADIRPQRKVIIHSKGTLHFPHFFYFHTSCLYGQFFLCLCEIQEHHSQYWQESTC